MKTDTPYARTTRAGRRLTPAGRALAERFLAKYPRPVALLIAVRRPLYLHAAARFGPDEVEAACVRAVADAAVRFRGDGDPAAELPHFTEVVKWAFRSELTVMLRRGVNEPSRFYRVHVDDDDAAADLYNPPAAVPAARWTDDDWDRVLGPLHPRDREVIVLRYRDGLTQSEVAGRLGVSRQRIDQIEEAALAVLRDRRPKLRCELEG